ncbi:MAG TPA: glycoside hydrolase family 16 protein [Gemmataceae bacterium]|nr:glycoside hydrolase family 16 protein [Gemmataceae bacterium]
MTSLRSIGPLAGAAALALFALVGHAGAPTGNKAPATVKSAGKEWKLVWNDEFDGTEIDSAKWGFDIGNGFYAPDGKTFVGGWGNNELEFYTDSKRNAFVKDGLLHIKAIKEDHDRYRYTSARMKTQKSDKSPLFNHAYGRFEFRAKLPVGKGVWPAIWMLPQDNKYGGWAASGEIDILEVRGQKPSEILGTLHYGGGWPTNTHTGETFTLPGGGTSADFHNYALEWEPGQMRWYFDDHCYETQKFWWSTSKRDGDKGAKPASEADLNPWPAPFDHPYYILLNVAVGGQFLGNPDPKTAFPVEMLIDYVRVYDKVGGYGPTPMRGEGKLPFAKK